MNIFHYKKITTKTDVIIVKIEAEEGFNPLTDIKLESLRFGASEKVNSGRGSRLKKTEVAGDDLILVFNGNENGITKDNFTGKLLGKDIDGGLLFGYARLLEIQYIEPILSARAPNIQTKEGKSIVKVEIPAIQPYEKRNLTVNTQRAIPEESNIVIKIPNKKMPLYVSGTFN